MTQHYLSRMPGATLPAALALVAAAMVSGPALAANGDGLSPQEQYRQDVEYCRSGQPGIDEQNCLRDAGAVLQESRSGRRDSADTGSIEQNQRARCEGLTGVQREDCMNLMSSTDVQTEGSVDGGGILRQTTITMPAD